jgi:hypothetical protein
MLNKIDPQQVQLDTSEPIGHQQASSSVIKMPTFQAGGAVISKEEAEFQKGIKETGWFKEYKKEYGEEPDLNITEYDYRKAWKAGVRPERDPYDNNKYHWGSSDPKTGEMLKSKDHPTAWKEDYMRKTGKNPDEEGVTKEQAGMAKGGQVRSQTQRMLKQGGMLQEGGTVDPVSGNKVPVGAMKEEVRDDVPAQLSEGEFVFPADVVRYIGLERLMQMRQAAKKGLMQMEDMGQMSNGEEGSEEEDTSEFESELDDIMSEMEGEGEEREMAVGGDVMPMEQAPAEQPAAPTMTAAQQTPEAIPTGAPTLTEEQMAKIQETAKNMQGTQSQLGDLPPNNPTEGLKSYDIVKSNFAQERQQDADAFLSKVNRLAKAKRVIMTRYNDTVVLGFVKSAGVVDPLVFSNDPPEKLNDAVIAGIQVAKKSGIRRFESNKSNPLMVSTLSKMGYPVEDLGDKGWALTLE